MTDEHLGRPAAVRRNRACAAPRRTLRPQRWWSAAAMVGVAAHHAIEDAAGLGLPGGPQLGPVVARVVWGAAIPAHIVAALRADRRRWDRPLALTNGAVVALAVQHYLRWPWRRRRGAPVITEAEELPGEWLAAYNAALLSIIATTALAAIRDYPTGCARWQVVGLLTTPLQYGIAGHHLRRHRPR